MKKTLLLFALLLTTLSSWAHDFEVDGIYYKITSTAYMTAGVSYQGSSYSSYSNEYTGKVMIPAMVSYNGKDYSVTSIENSAFRDCEELTMVTIPESVTSIGNYAFYGCTGLASITIPGGVTSMGYVFNNCSSLTGVIINSNAIASKTYTESSTL
ncbi:MAG: leucine-rich repeat domain-containing protein, partial [Bacteroidaceae bacterium]|nr:leucine-rich repeat domain-containing protein [Bacteroidaceae bacterium]